MSAPNTLTKDGLTGTSGLGALGLFHVSANYAAQNRKGPAKCFVEWFCKGDPVPTWRRMTVARAKREKRTIIPCHYCDKPAISLDHFFPYYDEKTHCADHRDAARNNRGDES